MYVRVCMCACARPGLRECVGLCVSVLSVCVPVPAEQMCASMPVLSGLWIPSPSPRSIGWGPKEPLCPSALPDMAATGSGRQCFRFGPGQALSPPSRLKRMVWHRGAGAWLLPGLVRLPCLQEPLSLVPGRCHQAPQSRPAEQRGSAGGFAQRIPLDGGIAPGMPGSRSLSPAPSALCRVKNANQ